MAPHHPRPRANVLSRRLFLQASAATGGGLILSFALPLGSGAAEAQFAPNAYIRIDADDRVTLVMPYVEMGQGTYTAIPMLIAEELECDLEKVNPVHAPPDPKHYGNPMLGGIQATGNSNAIRGAWKPLREAGAVGRSMLVAAAATRWGVDPGSCRARHGTVIHDTTGRSLRYGAIAAEAARQPVPKAVKLKRPEEFTLIGKTAHRLDAPEKVDGTAHFGIDARPEGLSFATLAQSPVFGGKLKSVDDTAAKIVKGVRQVVRLADAVAVVADHMGAAKKGLEALVIEWDDGPNATVGMERIVAELDAATRAPGAVAQAIGDVGPAMAGAASRVDAVYQVPFLAHATMEPMNCTANIRPDGCDVWIGTQAPARVQAAAAAAAGLPPEKITVHNHLIGGGFGRRLEVDGAIRTVQVARHVGGPVKLVWTREEDVQHDMYRPYWFDRISAGLDGNGMPVAWNHRFAGSSVIARWAPAWFQDGLDPDTTEGAINLPYALPNLRVEYARVEPPGVPTAFWRSVGPSHNVFVTESFIDELAIAAGKDPVDYRQALLADAPRARAVLDLAAQKAGWGEPLPARSGRGVAVQNVFGSFMAHVAEIEVASDGTVRVRRVTAAVDCGMVVNPDTVRAQIMGGAIFGITAALYGQITVKDGRVEQANFDTYQMVRMDEAPAVDVHIVDSAEHPGGIGEPGTSLIVPAVANAIYAATGTRLRRMPVDTEALRAPT